MFNKWTRVELCECWVFFVECGYKQRLTEWFFMCWYGGGLSGSVAAVSVHVMFSELSEETHQETCRNKTTSSSCSSQTAQRQYLRCTEPGKYHQFLFHANFKYLPPAQGFTNTNLKKTTFHFLFKYVCII